MKNSTNLVMATALALFAVVGVFAQCSKAAAYQIDDSRSHTLGIICCSKHVREQDKTLNEDNKGVFYRYHLSSTNMLMVGTFKNSFSRQSVFVGGGPHWQVGDFNFSLPIGFTTGYKDHPTPFAVPTVSYKYVNVHVVPSVVYAVSFNVVKW